MAVGDAQGIAVRQRRGRRRSASFRPDLALLGMALMLAVPVFLIAPAGEEGDIGDAGPLWKGTTRNYQAPPLCSLSSPREERQVCCEVIGVIDGDTIEVLDHAEPLKIRLHGIDCPEKSQPFGTSARQFTSATAFGRMVEVTIVDTDCYGRAVAEVTLPDGRSLNEELVRAGLAWWYGRYSGDRDIEALEGEARASRRGLWQDQDPVRPWEFRREESRG